MGVHSFLPVSKQAEKSAGVHSFLPVSKQGEKSAGVHSFFPVLSRFGKALVWGYALSLLGYTLLQCMMALAS